VAYFYTASIYQLKLEQLSINLHFIQVRCLAQAFTFLSVLTKLRGAVIVGIITDQRGHHVTPPATGSIGGNSMYLSNEVAIKKYTRDGRIYCCSVFKQISSHLDEQLP